MELIEAADVVRISKESNLPSHPVLVSRLKSIQENHAVTPDNESKSAIDCFPPQPVNVAQKWTRYGSNANQPAP